MARSWNEVIGDSDSSRNNKSFLARMGTFGQQYTDPLYWIFGRKYTDQLEEWADKSNSFLSKVAKQDPVVQFDRRNNPLQDTPEGKKAGDWAENKPVDSIAAVLGGVFGGGALAGGLGGGSGGAVGGSTAGSAGLGTGGASAAPSVAGFMPGTAAAPIEGITVVGSSGGAALSPTSAAAMGAVAASQGGATPQQRPGWRDVLDNMPQQSGQQEQQQASPGMPPQRQVSRQPGLMERIRGGLGKVGEGLFPIDQAYGMTPEQQRQARQQALLTMGLGMMAASNQGAGFGEAASFGLGRAQHNLTGALQRGYENARANRQEQRQMERDQIADERYREERDYRAEQDRIQNEQAERAYERALSNDERSESWMRLRYERDNNQFERAMRLREEAIEIQRAKAESNNAAFGKPPSGYRWKEDGSLEAIPGGPATKLTPEAAGKAALLAESARAANDAQRILFDEQGKLNRSNAAMGAAGLPWSEGKMARDRIRISVESTLRLITGAAAPESEVTRYTSMFTPNVFDTDEAAQQKIQALQRFIEEASAGLAQGRASGGSNRGASGTWSIEEVP